MARSRSRRKSRRSHKKRRSSSRAPRGPYSLRRSSYSAARCNALLAAKIRENIKEYHAGRWVSRSQAIAVAFSQVRKKHPRCKRFQKK